MTMRASYIGRRQFLGAAAMGSASAVLGLGPARRAVAQAPKRGGTLKAGITGFGVISTLDPAKAGLISEFYVIWGLYNTLVKFDQTMNIVPDLAASWSNPNERTWQFVLRDNVKFHDGSAMTAEDVKYSFERVMDPQFGSPHRGKLAELEEIKVLDARTIRLVTKRPFAPLLAYLSNTRTGTQIVSPRAVEKWGKEFGAHPTGTGPFRLVDWKPNQSVTYERFADYFLAGRPYLDRVDILLVPEEATGTTAILAGDVDVTSTALFSDVRSLETARGVKVLKMPGLNCRMIVLNTAKPPFDDPEVRRAFALAFDRRALVAAVLFGEGVPSHGLVPEVFKWAYDPQPGGQTFDPARARAHLAKAKYRKDQLDVKILTWGSGWWKRFGEIVSSQINEVLGLNTQVEVSEAGAVTTRIREGNFQGSVWGWLGLIDPDEYLYENFHSRGSRNYSKYANPEVDRLLEEARTVLDQGRRGALYKKAEKTIGEDAPNLFAFNSNVHNLVRDRVQGFVQLPYSAFGAQFADVWLA